MTQIYILIIIGQLTSTGTGIASVEFSDKRACEDAARATRVNMDSWAATVKAFCVPKGSGG
jgi:hypothetical protein